MGTLAVTHVVQDLSRRQSLSCPHQLELEQSGLGVRGSLLRSPPLLCFRISADLTLRREGPRRQHVTLVWAAPLPPPCAPPGCPAGPGRRLSRAANYGNTALTGRGGKKMNLNSGKSES